MIVIADASVVVAALTDDTRTAEADRLLRMTLAAHAPDLLVAEVANAAWRLLQAERIAADQFDQMLIVIDDLIDELHPLLPLAPRAAEIARMLDHPVYDCFYLALAERLGCPFATFDRRLLARLDGTPFEGRARLPEQISGA